MNNYVHKSVNKIVVNDERIARFVAQAVGSDDFTAHGTIGVCRVSSVECRGQREKGLGVLGGNSGGLRREPIPIKIASNPPAPIGEIIAGIVYDNFNGANICMHVAARPGVNWVSRKLIHLAFDYPFRQLGCRRVTGLVPESNLAARRFNEHLGFKVEARIRHGAPDGDVLLYAMFREECRWLTIGRPLVDRPNVTNWSHSREQKASEVRKSAQLCSPFEFLTGLAVLRAGGGY